MRWLLDNLPLKLASLALASLLWFVIAGEKTSELGLEVPVELRNFPLGLELLEEPPRSLEVRLRASPGLLQGLGAADVHAALDLEGVTEGERILHLTADSIQVPFGVDVVKIAPSMVKLRFEPTRQRLVAVRPSLSGQPAEGYELLGVTAQPAELLVAGPASRVAAVESAFTEPVSVAGARGPVITAVAVGLEDPLLRINGEQRVRVTATVREHQLEREFELPVRTPQGGTPRPERVAVRLRGPASTMAELTAEHITASAAPDSADAEGRLKVVLELAVGYRDLELLGIEPARVRVR